ncbi:iron-containing alcohol dehydrogenase family protein [Ammoniphilus resinae]|uniref:Glycerol dehydrogenase n=1 Tax=Ammoniphilus resinae TaxID=861532 RepID=A0ABS4GLS3_9BACL|nr:iron-containing alcohol dehydrogenase family protein [Ammoniphilus resinae]MBP1931204.1 glycerol dehydrogenase [Ammoniphilus resinae]
MQSTVGPASYIRQRDVIETIGQHAKKFGQKALIIGGKTALSTISEKMLRSLEENGIVSNTEWYGGESSWTEINRLIQLVESVGPQFLIAAGGGKALDTVKAVAYATNLPLIAVPTIAATCAAATQISIIYNDEGIFTEISRRSKAPDLVLVDTTIISHAPVRFLIAGIGDTLAKWFESRASSQKSVPTALVRTAVKIANELYLILLEFGKSAIESARNRQVTSALNDVIDAIILISGSVSGYGGDACRTAAAHAIYSGLTIFPEVHETYHGEIVAFGILSQLVLEGKEDSEIRELISFYRQIQLPTTLKDMGIVSLTEEQLQQFGSVAVEIEDMANMPFTVTPEMVIQAVIQADSLGTECK